MCRSTGSPAASPSTTTPAVSRRAGSGRRRDAGFTLLEVLIAFAVLAVMLVPILQVFGGGLGLTQTARGYAEGALLARSKLAEVSGSKDLQEGDTSGDFEDRGYRWRASVVQDQSVVTLPDNTVVGPSSPFRGNDLRRQRGDDDDATSDSRSGGSLFERHRGNTGSGSGSSSLFGGSSGSSGSSLFGRSGSGSGSSSLFGRSSSGSSSGSSFGSSSSSSLFGRSSSGSGSSSSFGHSSSFGRSSGGTSASGSSRATSGGSAAPSGASSDTEDASGGLDRIEPLPYRISVTVAWGSAWSGGGEVTLTTLRLKQPANASASAPE